MIARVVLIFAVFSLLALPVNASNQKDSRVAKKNPYTKLTVGPYDNYQATINLKGDLFFTRNINLVTHIYTQDRNGNDRILLDDTANAKDPVVSPDGSLVAFTYFKFDSKGDICVLARDISGAKPECITAIEVEAHSPFWLSSHELGYVARKPSRPDWELRVFDLRTKALVTLTQGPIANPTADSSGQLIAYNRYDESREEWRVNLMDRRRPEEVQQFRFDLPGVSGFLSFNSSSSFLYFSHYLNDTNFDQIIDANDHSVIFRYPIEPIRNGQKPFFPEQLTSVEQNCNFPKVTDTFLLITCAFEGSLDAYKISLEGENPKSWTYEDLQSAHASSRSYTDRLLILNTMRYRFPKRSTETSMLERIVSNHVQLGETTAGIFYLNRLISGELDESVRAFFKSLKVYLEVYEAKRAEPLQRSSMRFRALVDKKKQELSQLRVNHSLRVLILAYFDEFLGRRREAQVKLESLARSRNLSHPMEGFLRVRLSELVYSNKPRRRLQWYQTFMMDKRISEESRLYYCHKFLSLLGKVYPKLLSKRRTIVEALIKKSTSLTSIQAALRLEILLYDLLEETDKKQKKEGLMKATDLMTEHRENYFLSKLLYIRSIHLLSEAEEVSLLNDVAGEWLRNTDIRSTEYSYAGDQYSIANLDLAYNEYAAGKYQESARAFYLGIRQRDDLESHYGFFLTRGIKRGRMEAVNKSYEDLVKRKIVGQNHEYAKALQALSKYFSLGEVSFARLNKAELLLKRMSFEGSDMGLRYLLLGQIYHIRLLQSRSGFDYDRSLFKAANRNYILALDLEKENFRSKSAILENLARINMLVGSYDIASAYFTRRNMFDFLSKDDELFFLWDFARTQFYSYRYKEAVLLMERAEKLGISKNALSPIQERKAFYSYYAQDFEKAITTYNELIENSTIQHSHENLAKMHLGRAYALARSKENASNAKQDFLRAIAAAEKTGVRSEHKYQPIAFRPERIQILAYGMLSQMSKDVSEAITYKRKRIALIENFENEPEDYASDLVTLAGQLAKDYTQLAILYERAKDVAMVRQSMSRALSWSEKSGELIDPDHYRVILNIFAWGIKKPELFRGFLAEDLKKKVSTMTEAMKQSLKLDPQEGFRLLQLQLFSEVFFARLSGDRGAMQRSISQILSQPMSSELQRSTPEKYQILLQYKRNFVKM